MDFNLTLTAQTWQLAATIDLGARHGGVMMVKNTPEHTYLCVTPKQWQVLLNFRQPRTAPQVLETIIEERLCPALGEYYELILKAVNARILVDPSDLRSAPGALNWPVSLRPRKLRMFFWMLFVVGLGFAVGFRPELPTSVLDVLGGLAAVAIALAFGLFLSASLLRGGGGEVYRGKRGLPDLRDVCMLSPSDQRTVAFGTLALLAAATGFLAWHRPTWAFVALIALLVRMRPILKGEVSTMIRVGAQRRLSDAEHHFIFPPNRSARLRWKMLWEGLRNPTTWSEVAYAVIWTIALMYFVGTVTEVPPWDLRFWQDNGLRLAVAFCGSLAVLGAIYLGSEFYLFARSRMLARHQTFRQAWRRWFGRKKVSTDEAARHRAILRSPLLRQLPPQSQQALVRAIHPESIAAWKTLHEFDQPVDRVSLILSGRVGVYRRSRSGRRELIQVLCENDLVGLHAIGDPEFPQFLYRTLTPVVLLRVDWPVAQEHIVEKFSPGVIGNLVQKLPFLARISLCQNWHLQSIQRFAEITRTMAFQEGDVILPLGFYSESFFIVFEGRANVTVRGQQVGTIGSANFFGEIGLLQNSTATAQVVATTGTRCLCVPRREFLRFVAHNYTVALRLERVSSQRLGRPIFPLTPGNFRQI